jgi:hypothetical protein
MMFEDILELGKNDPKPKIKDKNFFEIFDNLFKKKVKEYFANSM